MKTTKMLVGATCALTLAIGSIGVAHGAPPCSERITRATVIPCALEASLALQSEQQALSAIDGRSRSAAVLLPSNPALSVTGGIPIDDSTTERTALWSVALSQELEIAGQRGARLDVVGAERRGQETRFLAVQRQVAADALAAYLDALASTEYLNVAHRLSPLAAALKEVARARAEVGIGSNVDAILAEAVAIRLEQAQIEAEQRVATTSAILATLLGLNPNEAKPSIEGDLKPLDIAIDAREALVANAIARRADLAVLTAEREAQARRIKLFERLRIPNPTVSVFARRDWIGERAAGVGLSFPLPLPSPLGRTYAGEIDEAEALTRRTEVQAEQLRRSVRLEVIRAVEAVSARQRQVALYTSAQLRRTQTALTSLAEELVAKRLPIREALIAQQGLLETLSGYIDARKGLCIASVELARVTGVELERGVR